MLSISDHIGDFSLNSIEIWVSIQKYKLLVKEMRKNPNYEMNPIERDYQETNPQI